MLSTPDPLDEIGNWTICDSSINYGIEKDLIGSVCAVGITAASSTVFARITSIL
jgi:hypothetical protein